MTTKIEWTDETWNPIRARRLDTGKVGWHCELHSTGCENCYAQTLNGRNLPGGGTGLEYKRKSRDLVETFVHVPTLGKPLHWRKPKMVFVCSMTDLFGEWITDEQICQVFAVMACAHWHTFQVLTKRPDRMRAWLTEYAAGGRHVWLAGQLLQMPRGMDKPLTGWPLPNVWLGVSTEDQKRADERIPDLLQTPAAIQFASYEPALGPIDFTCHWYTTHNWHNWLTGETGMGRTTDNFASHPETGKKLGWIIGGCESGAKRRPASLEWFADTKLACSQAGVAYFQKQVEVKGVVEHDMKKFPAAVRVQDFPAKVAV